MSILSDSRFFVKRYVKNPIIVAAISFMLYKWLNRYIKTESLAESIKVLEVKGSKSLIFDDKTKKYIVVDTQSQDVFSSDKEDVARKAL